MSGSALREHKRISDAIDEAYMEVIISGTDLRVFLRRPRGNPDAAFMRFYGAFYEAFTYTCQAKEIASLGVDAEISKIWQWFDTEPPRFSTSRAARDKFCKHAQLGLDLFLGYQKSMISSGIININRE